MAPRALRASLVCIAAAMACAGCARESAPLDGAASQRQAAFEKARERCGVTVAETAAVQRCMRAQGWAYRLPWQ